ncbi:hypothetical protein [Methylocystis sp.]|uniref:hypothetical protein n=1 Tax=Methylocystis sp. TaxID=1911079 RepID=UPI0025F011BA|nr:hypothetical protein [Methylocystis sp.]
MLAATLESAKSHEALLQPPKPSWDASRLFVRLLWRQDWIREECVTVEPLGADVVNVRGRSQVRDRVFFLLEAAR